MERLFRWTRIVTGTTIAAALALLMAFPSGLPEGALHFSRDQLGALACVLIASAIALTMGRWERRRGQAGNATTSACGAPGPGGPVTLTGRRQLASRYQRLERTRHMPIIPNAGSLGLVDDERTG